MDFVDYLYSFILYGWFYQYKRIDGLFFRMVIDVIAEVALINTSLVPSSTIRESRECEVEDGSSCKKTEMRREDDRAS